ncbi:MAG: DNA primase small subunit PriS [Candidatus Thorarchaeota archaeon]
MDWKTRKFIQLTFQSHYRAHPEKVSIPEKLNMREFGVESFKYNWTCNRRRVERRYVLSKHSFVVSEEIGCGEKGSEFLPTLRKCPRCGASGLQWNNWTRHLGFGSAQELTQFLVESPPHSIYHSAAFYRAPVARNMDEKGWQGAELVFDIDADHLNSPCKNVHDKWICKKCGRTGTNEPPDNGCPECGGTTFGTLKWICERCLGLAKTNALRLYDKFLVEDLGIEPTNIRVNYSGHRGYHVRVLDPDVSKLDSSARIEIIHFVTGRGINARRILGQQERVIVVPRRGTPGWHGKAADALISYLTEIDGYQESSRWTKILKNQVTRQQTIDGLKRDPPILRPVKGIGYGTWQEILTSAASKWGAEIDEPVTHDLHRVIRLAGSLNGKTGFLVRPVTRDEADDFDPLSDSIVFEGKRKIRVRSSVEVPPIRIGDVSYGPYTDEVIEMPLSAAMFFLCKGVATVE